MPLVDMKEPPEWPEPQTFCDSCWWYDDIQGSRFGVVMYCHYHEEPREDYEICDEFCNENAVLAAKRGRL